MSRVYISRTPKMAFKKPEKAVVTPIRRTPTSEPISRGSLTTRNNPLAQRCDSEHCFMIDSAVLISKQTSTILFN